MPDLVTHIAGAYLINRGWKIARGAVFFYLGAMLPDLITRPFHIIYPPLLPATMGMHSPAAAFLVCWLISLVFRIDQRRPVFWLLFSGCLVHFLMDAAQKHLTGGYLWLFPFSNQTYSWGIIWPEDALRFLPLTGLVVLLFWVWSLKNRGRKTRSSGQTPATDTRSPDRLPQ
jgi:hypothetical protein